MSIDVRAAMAPLDQQFLTTLQNNGWQPHELQSLARAWHIAEQDITAVIGTTPTTDHTTTEIRIAIIAAGVEHAINTKATPNTPAIINATPTDLLNFIDYYHAELDRIYRALIQAQLDAPGGRGWEDATWCALRAQFDRLAGFLWECEAVAGIHDLNTSLDKQEQVLA